MDIIYMQKEKIIIISRNQIAVPRIGDHIVMDNIKVKVLDVIWHLGNITWVEIQI